MFIVLVKYKKRNYLLSSRNEFPFQRSDPGAGPQEDIHQPDHERRRAQHPPRPRSRLWFFIVLEIIAVAPPAELTRGFNFAKVFGSFQGCLVNAF
jgi:hypothetical protein